MIFIKLSIALNHMKLEQHFSISPKLLMCGTRDWFSNWNKMVQDIILKLFQNYLNNRKQRVVLYCSLCTSIILKKILNQILYFFADDTMLFSIVKDPDISG